MNERTLDRQRSQFVGIEGEEMKRLKELREIARLKRLFVNLELDIRRLKGLAEEGF